MRGHLDREMGPPFGPRQDQGPRPPHPLQSETVQAARSLEKNGASFGSLRDDADAHIFGQ